MKKHIRGLLSVAAAAALVFAASSAVYAEDGSAEDSRDEPLSRSIVENNSKGAGYSSVIYDSGNGLPTSEANAVMQSSDGFVWIGSYCGLIRYDGNEFYRYDSSLGISSVVSLFEDSKERIWIGTNDSGVAYYYKGSFKLYDQIEGLKSSAIHSISEDAYGNIIIATTLGLAYVNDKDELHIIDDPLVNTQSIEELERDGDGIIYGITNNNSYFTLDNMNITSYYSGEDLGIGKISCICPDSSKKNCIFMGSLDNSIAHVDMSQNGGSVTVTDVSPLKHINKIEYIDGNLWICGDNGIGYLSSDGKFIMLEGIPMTNSIDDIMRDYEGNLWFASSRQGIMKICRSEFTDLNVASGLPEMVVNTTCVHNGDLYIGTDSGLYVMDARTYQQKTNELSEMLKGVRIRCAKEDSKGNMWLSTYGKTGLVCLEKDGGIVSYNSDNGLDCQKIRISEEISDGRIAVSTDKGIYFLKDKQVVGHITSANGLSAADILTICEGGSGEIYFGSDGDGLYVYKNNSLTRLSKKDGLRSEVILRIKKDGSDGTIWMITSNSIAYMSDGGIVSVRNFPYSNNFDIFFDGQGGVWILSSNGIYITTTEQLKNDNNIAYLFYDTSCGLPSVATANSRSCLTVGGELYIAGVSGVSYININDVRSDNDKIMLSVPFIGIDDKLVAVKNGQYLNIPSSCKRLTIYGYALTFSLKNPRLSYDLIGFDDVPVEKMRTEMQPVSYTNLRGGIYRYELSIMNTLTGNKEQTVFITINKELAFYEQVWFKITVVIAAGIVMFLIFEFIRRKREATLIKEQEKKQILIDEMTKAFAKCVDMKDNYTNGHSFRVAEYSKLLAEKLGKDEKEIKQIYNVALLHDIGKISIPDNVLNKPGRPTDEEYATLKTHTSNGYDVLKEINIAPELANGAGYHHERLDGKGYPNGLKGDEIPEVAQIIAVADTFDAMYSTRPYRKQMDVKDVIAELKRVSGTQLNEKIVNYLVELINEGRIGERKL